MPLAFAMMRCERQRQTSQQQFDKCQVNNDSSLSSAFSQCDAVAYYSLQNSFFLLCIWTLFIWFLWIYLSCKCWWHISFTFFTFLQQLRNRNRYWQPQFSLHTIVTYAEKAVGGGLGLDVCGAIVSPGWTLLFIDNVLTVLLAFCVTCIFILFCHSFFAFFISLLFFFFSICMRI